jgi:AcrR family transcriptional regulator
MANVDPRVRRTRQQLGEAFQAAVWAKGFQAVTVQDIAARAGVNRTTFYLHFPDKFALAEYVIGQTARQAVAEHLPDIARLTPANLRKLIFMVFEFVRRSNAPNAPHDPQLEVLVEQQVRQQIQALLQQGLQHLQAPAAAQLAATAASWVIYGLAQQWQRDGQQPPIDQQVDRVLPLLVALLGLNEPPAGDSRGN